MQVDELSVLITANAEQFKQELAKMSNALDNVKKSTLKSTSGITKAFSALKKGAAALAIGAANIYGTLLSSNKNGAQIASIPSILTNV